MSALRVTSSIDPLEPDVALASAGDAQAFERLYLATVDRTFGLARRMAGARAADDLTQEVYLRAWSKLHTFRGDAAFSTWLHRIAVNAALQAVRRAGTRSKREAPMPETVPVEPMLRDTLLQKRLEAALDRLPEGMRQVLILHDVEGYTHEEIGEVLGIAAGTSKSQLFKARAKMRALLGSIDQQDADRGVEAWNI